jgi:hypothetical protein
LQRRRRNHTAHPLSDFVASSSSRENALPLTAIRNVATAARHLQLARWRTSQRDHHATTCDRASVAYKLDEWMMIFRFEIMYWYSSNFEVELQQVWDLGKAPAGVQT